MILLTVHYIHILSGVIWGGGTVIAAVLLFPALLGLPTGRAAEIYQRIGKSHGRLMASTAGTAMVFGGLRAWLGGGVTVWSDLTSAYGALVLLAFAIMTSSEIFAAQSRRAMDKLMADEARISVDGPGMLRRIALIHVVTVLAILAVMASLGMGFY